MEGLKRLHSRQNPVFDFYGGRAAYRDDVVLKPKIGCRNRLEITYRNKINIVNSKASFRGLMTSPAKQLFISGARRFLGRQVASPAHYKRIGIFWRRLKKWFQGRCVMGFIKVAGSFLSLPEQG